MTRWIGLVLVMLSLPLLMAQEPNDAKKSPDGKEMKKEEPKKDEPKKDAPKAETPKPTTGNDRPVSFNDKYKAAKEVANATIKSIDLKEMQIVFEIKSQMAGGRGRQNYKTKTFSYSVDMVEDARIRTSQPPEQIGADDKPKKLSAEEKARLKGPDSKVPGYEAALADLKSGQTVTLYLSTIRGEKKPAAPTASKPAKPTASDKGKAKGKEMEKEESDVEHLEGLHATTVLIHNEARAVDQKGKKK